MKHFKGWCLEFSDNRKFNSWHFGIWFSEDRNFYMEFWKFSIAIWRA